MATNNNDNNNNDCQQLPSAAVPNEGLTPEQVRAMVEEAAANRAETDAQIQAHQQLLAGAADGQDPVDVDALIRSGEEHMARAQTRMDQHNATIQELLERRAAEDGPSREELEARFREAAVLRAQTDAEIQAHAQAIQDHEKRRDQEFAALSEQNEELKAALKAQGDQIATLRENQEGTQRDVALLRTAVTLLGNSLQESLVGVYQAIRGLGTSLVGGMRLLDARTRSNRNFASTMAFFSIVLAIVLGYYLLATTLLAITLGFYFLFKK